MAMGHDEVCEDTSPLQTQKRIDGKNITDPKTGLPVRINCVQCGTEIVSGHYCAACLKT